MSFQNLHNLRLRDIKVFSPEWFKFWQGLLLLAVNFPIMGVREEVRHRLGIDQDGLPLSVPIFELMAHAYTIRIGGIEFITTFRTHSKYAKRLYYEWTWIWNLIHKWDTSFANKFIPALNLGFDSLTAYPDADTEVSTVDGYINFTWNTPLGWSYGVNAATGTNAYDSYDYGSLAGSKSSSYYISRGIFLFKTTIPVGCTITEAYIGIYGSYSKQETDSNATTVHIVSSSPASNTQLVVGDYDSLGSTSFGSITYANLNTTGYTNFAFNSSGIGNITKGTNQISKFGARLACDLNSNTPTGANSFMFITADDAASGNAKDPKLVVTYTSGWSKKINGISPGKFLGISKSSISKINGI